MKSSTPLSARQTARTEAVRKEESARRMSIHSLLSSPEDSNPPPQTPSTSRAPSPGNAHSSPSPAPVAKPGNEQFRPAHRGPFPPKVHPIPQLQSAVGKGGRRNRKHVCQHPECGREFSRKSNLEAHSRKHMTGEKATPYSCCYCARRFKWRSSQKSHEAGCMHQSLPAAIRQQEEKLSKQRDQVLQQLQQQEQAQIERRVRLEREQMAGRGAHPAGHMDNTLSMEGGGRGQGASIGEVQRSRAENPLAVQPQSDYQPYPNQSAIRQNGPAFGQPDTRRAPGLTSLSVAGMLTSAPRAESNGMLESLRLPFPGDLAAGKAESQ